MNKKGIIIIAIIICLIGTTVFFGIKYVNAKNSTKLTNCKCECGINDDGEQIIDEENLETYDCEDDLDYIYPLMVNARKTSFTNKYFPEDYKPLTIKKENIKCNQIKTYNNIVIGLYYDISLDGANFQCFSSENKCYEYSYTPGFSENNIGSAFMYAKKIIQKDYDNLIKNYKSETGFGIYPLKYNNGDTFNLEIREYKGEVDYSGKLIATYTVNFKTRTFIKK